MKKIIVLLSILCCSAALFGQQRWTVSHQKKTILKNVGEDEKKNIIQVKKAALSLPGCLTISFKINDGTVNRTLMADDSSRVGLKSWENVKKTISIKNADLKKLFNGQHKLLLYFTEIPKDPSKAAVVRMRPIHICTLILK
ncbi:MAG: hypothetical protein HZA79_02750 [Sphingobacteriales bacterium]|nr:hypothetical protein [Sphingobacteriales bacterium]